MEYKIEAVSQVWSLDGLTEKATVKANYLARDGWILKDIRQGWSGFMFSTIYMAFERPEK